MPYCPVCNVPLQKNRLHQKLVFHCLKCQGYLVSIVNLKAQTTEPGIINQLWRQAREDLDPQGRDCPYCQRPMALVRLPEEKNSYSIDICSHCLIFWFDAKELSEIPLHKQELQEKADQEFEQKYQKELKFLNLEKLDKQKRESFIKQTRPSLVNFIFSIFGFPFEEDENWFSYQPFITWTLSFIMILVYVLTMIHDNQLIYSLGFIPDQAFRYFGMTTFSSFFLHASLFHVLGNLYFFLTFGDNVEDELGKFRYILLLFSAHMFGLLLHALFEPQGDIPLVGASGGISGILAYYAISFPKKKIGFMFYFRWLSAPSWFYFGLWILMQVGNAIQQSLGAAGNVSGLGHLGGILVGIIVAFNQDFKKKNLKKLIDHKSGNPI
jgi:membrane associated rhomboid family serine protease